MGELFPFPENISTFGGRIDTLFAVIVVITGVVFVVVEAALLYFVVKYRHREGRKAYFYHGNKKLEIFWTSATAVIVLALAIASRPLWLDIKHPDRFPAPGLELIVTAKQFEWNVTYPGADGRIGTADDFVKRNQLHVPAGVPVRFTLASEDVIHSFWLPQLRLKQDAVPGMHIPVWFEATTPGTYEMGCAELCGLAHYRMRASVTVHSAADFATWQQNEIAAAAGGAAPPHPPPPPPPPRPPPSPPRRPQRPRQHRPPRTSSNRNGANMSTTVIPHEAHEHADAHHHDDRSFVSKYIFSTDHKIIGIQFLFMSLFFLFVGGLLAMGMRWQLAWPSNPDMPLPGGSLLPETMVAGGVMLPEFYNASVTMHGTIMIFFAIMPLLVGVWANYLIPLQIGAEDMAFPRLNMASFWTAVPAGLMMMVSFWVTGGAANAGWTGYAPLSTTPEYSGVHTGQQLWALSLIILGFSSLMGSVNYITTVINMRAPGMTWFRMPLATWALFITSILILLAIPVLAGAMILMFFDQTLGTTFYTPQDGGQPLLWQHLFWFFGHPEVYILILPSFGFVSEMLSNGARKPIFGYHFMVFAIAGIAFLGWIVWGHHMFMSGMQPMIGMGFMMTTMLIAVPTAIKIFNWLGTLWRGDLHFHVPMLHAVGFIAMFLVGGLSGIFLANTPVDIPLHDGYFVVAHIHYVLFGGSLFGIFGAITYWFPKMFGRMMNSTLGKIHFWLSFIFFNLVFFPMHGLGTAGMPRRYYDTTQYEYLRPYQDTNIFISICAFILFSAQLIFAFNFFWSLFKGQKATANPWHANSLEWQAPSPPPHGNWGGVIPLVYRGPYEYSSPESDRDFLPQTVPPEEARRPAPRPEPAAGD